MKEYAVKLSVLMPAYNAEDYIAEAIDSLLQQSFTDFELIIINDGSTDSTQHVIRSFEDPRIILISQENHGIASALNTGLSNAKTLYIARFDSDDICFPQRFQLQFDFLESHPEYVLVGSDAEYISATGDHLFNFKCIAHTHEEVMEKIYFRCPFIHSAVMYRRDEVMKAGGYSLYAHNFEDYFLWIQLKGYGKFCNLPLNLIKVRFNPSSATIDEKWRGRIFRKKKRYVIEKASITKEEGDEFLAIIKSQETAHIKEGAYYALCGKKFLIDNYQPQKARPLLSKAIRIHPYRWDNYALYLLSYFPAPFIEWLHKLLLTKYSNQ